MNMGVFLVCFYWESYFVFFDIKGVEILVGVIVFFDEFYLVLWSWVEWVYFKFIEDGVSVVDVFYFVILLLLGYGFLGKLVEIGWDLIWIVCVWVVLMECLGYDCYVV